MKKGKSKRKFNGRIHLEQRLRSQNREAKQAENRRKLISKLDRKTALMVTQEFAKLGLYQ